MTQQEFINTFTKGEVFEVLWSNILKIDINDFCAKLYESKVDKLIKEMEELTTQSENYKTAKDVFEHGKKWNEIDEKLKKLHREFISLR